MEQGARKVLLDVREMTGFASPGLAQRAEMVRRWADTVHGRAKVAMISRREINDPERFDIVVARRLGFDADLFESEVAALEWLHQQPALWTGPPPEF
ncbi:hypothetical protein [Arenimonas daejeonensis]|uniref:hypothetical protein n=1 Tax=Arenimonas daejeonensis TaxID=370777 RepID=UPI0011BDA277|nr:hypothetical protein [Arenimonas daejeonensis]